MTYSRIIASKMSILSLLIIIPLGIINNTNFEKVSKKSFILSETLLSNLSVG